MKTVDKKFCGSSFLAFRYIEKNDMEFCENYSHKNIKKVPNDQLTFVKTAMEIDTAIHKVFEDLKARGEKIGIMLSGGMDSAILASYMKGCNAYTFRFKDDEINKSEQIRAEFYADYYGLTLHCVDISWDMVLRNTPIVMKNKCAPVHSIEPQIYEAACLAKQDGVTKMIIGESSDLNFGGMDQLLSKDWTFEEFVKRYTFVDPQIVLEEAADISYLYENYRQGELIDYMGFLQDVYTIESRSSYMNAFSAAQMEYLDPYANLKMEDELDLFRIRHGEPKYLIRELFARKYPDIAIPVKVPMPRPVDTYFANWKGPAREEFKSNLNMNHFSGNDKWLLYCLEWFLNLMDSGEL